MLYKYHLRNRRACVLVSNPLWKERLHPNGISPFQNYISGLVTKNMQDNGTNVLKDIICPRYFK